MFEQFTVLARLAASNAHKEAEDLRHSHIGTEHLLLGLMLVGEGVASRALVELGLDYETLRGIIKGQVVEGTGNARGELCYTPRIKKVMELALHEARPYGHHYIHTGYLLLAIVREGQGEACKALDVTGKKEQVRGAVDALLNEREAIAAEASAFVDMELYVSAGVMEVLDALKLPPVVRVESLVRNYALVMARRHSGGITPQETPLQVVELRVGRQLKDLIDKHTGIGGFYLRDLSMLMVEYLMSG